MLFFNQVEVDLCGSGCCGTGKNLFSYVTKKIFHLTFLAIDLERFYQFPQDPHNPFVFLLAHVKSIPFFFTLVL